MKQPAKSKKGFEAARLVVFTITGPLLTHLNCGIRDEETRRFSRELHDQRLLRIEPRIPVSSFVAPCKALADVVLVEHVEKCPVAVLASADPRGPIDPVALVQLKSVHHGIGRLPRAR